jgi:hypothetical protein
MEIDQIFETFTFWKGRLSGKQRRYVHFRSMSNFVFHFHNLPDNTLKNKVLTILNSYVAEVEGNNFEFSSKESYTLVEKYLNTLSQVYSEHLKFRSLLGLRFIIIFSLLGDGLLYLLLKSHLTFYFPIVSLSLATHYLYTKLYFEKKKLVFGIFY